MISVLFSAPKQPVQLDWQVVVEGLAQALSGGQDGLVDPRTGERGAWCFTRPTWEAVSALRRQLKAPVFPFECASDRKWARTYASQYAYLLYNRITHDMGRPAVAQDILAAWMMGFDGYRRAGFDFRKVKPAVAAAIKRLEAWSLAIRPSS